ncbi:MAG: phage capsid protein, partial [Ruminiclostridium sp.]|nr:phage capsid protein [Ruminiclostridium sp.]
MNKSLTIRLPLQFFAEDGAGAAGNAANADGTAGTEGTTAAGEASVPPSFDELMKNKDYQSEFDKRVNKALETARAKWDEQKKAELTE